ncbi:hypothetical protein ABE867_02365 [Enterococcus gallinarum]|uniref:hypothetical protein n=1 Tax=Enterococcus TaxID=1350 RepID=UPI000CF22844|nr:MULTISPECIES: hypothetical protein [Enterococcus]PQE54919.1 hypothetical protein CUS05_12305 [Enterococcus faecalis]ROY85595.1 hypothetical protein EGW76_13205 [Enterococcus gallinarum]
MKKAEMFTNVASMLLLIISITLLSLIYADIDKIGSINFDSSKWLDADIFLWRWGWYSLITGVLLNILSFILRLRGRVKK